MLQLIQSVTPPQAMASGRYELGTPYFRARMR